MGQEDYLKRQIDEAGKVLGKILADLLALKIKGITSEGVEGVNQILINKLDLDINQVINIPTDKFIQTLQREKKFNNRNLDDLATIFFLIAGEFSQTDPGRARQLYEKCLVTYDYLNNNDDTYSLERHNRIEKIKNLS